MIPTLEFQNATFHPGTNLTVRRGNKWAEHKEAYIDMQIKSLSTKVVKFSELTNRDLIDEHDPRCRTVAGLYEEMRKIYRHFSRDETVTLVRFIR